MRNAAILILAYLFGSIPFGYLIVRFSAGTDIRETGSGGTGATNVSRRAGKAAGLLTLLLDAAKGAGAIVLARLMTNQPVLGVPGSALQSDNWIVALAAVAVLIGHIFPVWLRFRGGKGVATAIGVFLLLAPVAVLICGAAFFVIVAFTRYVSLGSIVSATILPFLILLFSRSVDSRPVLFAAISSALLVIFAHRANVGRLISGTESRFR